MSVVSSDIKFYGCINASEADGVTVGGAIQLTTRVVFDSSTLANVLSDTVECLSSSGSDTAKNVVVTGRNAAGSIVTDTIALNGTNVISGVIVFDRILKIVLSGACVGTVTIRKASTDVTIIAMEPGLLTVRRLGYNCSADTSTGSARTYYDKFFIKNTNSTNALLSCTVAESADPTGNLSFDLEASKDGTNTSTNRQTSPASNMLGNFDNSTKNCPGTDLLAGESIGCWTKISLAAGTSPAVTTWTAAVAGQTT